MADVAPASVYIPWQWKIPEVLPSDSLFCCERFGLPIAMFDCLRHVVWPATMWAPSLSPSSHDCFIDSPLHTEPYQTSFCVTSNSKSNSKGHKVILPTFLKKCAYKCEYCACECLQLNRSVPLYVYIYIFTHTHTHTHNLNIYHVHLYICTSIHLHILLHNYLYIYIIYYNFIYTSIHVTSIHLYIYTCLIIFTSIHLHIYTSIHPYIHTSIHPYIHLYLYSIIRFLEWKMCPRKCALAPPLSEPPSWARPNVRHSFASPPGRNLGRKWPWKSLEKLKISGMCINRLILVYRWFSQL